MKNNINILIVLLALILILSLAFSLSAFAADGVISDSKDGLTANMTLTAENENVMLDVEVINESGTDVWNVAVTVDLPDGFKHNMDGVTRPVDLDLMIGERTTLSYTIVNTLALPETEMPTATAESETGGCGAAISGAAVIFALVCAAFLIVKDPKRGTACLLACMLLVPLVLPARAATTDRKIELEGIVTYDEKEYPIKVTVSYEYTFTEQKGVDTKGMDKFEITYYYGPQGQDLCNEEYIKKIAECGFTSIPVEGYDPAINKTALGLLRKYGMTCSGLKDNRLIHAQTLTSQPEIDALVFETVNDYKDYLDVIKEWWIKDEPCATDFPALARVVDALERIDPERGVMINLFPTYASAAQLGTSTYQEHLDKYIEIVKPDYISYDHYHFRKTENRKGFFENIEIVRDTAIANELDPMLIILLTEHMGYADLTKYQIEWEVNMCLTYGMKRVSYFTYWLCQSLLNEGWSNACMDTTGKVYQHYYDVQEINKWLLPLGNELFDKNSTAVFHVKSRGSGLEKGCEAYTSYGDLGEINGSGFVIGFFSDGSFMITNKSFADTENARNTLEFIDITANLEYFDAASASWKDAESAGVVARNENGTLQITFEPGQGVLFRVSDK